MFEIAIESDFFVYVEALWNVKSFKSVGKFTEKNTFKRPHSSVRCWLCVKLLKDLLKWS